MGEVKDEIIRAIKTLGLNDQEIKLIERNKAEKIYNDCLDHFVKSGDRRWWWEDFTQGSFDFKNYDHPFKYLNDILPDLNKKVWLMVEDNQEEFYPIYDCNPKIIGQIIGECFGFEYYVIDKDRKWLICENHHNRLIGIGNELRDRNLDKIKE